MSINMLQVSFFYNKNFVRFMHVIFIELNEIQKKARDE